jgi:hypothetical protein
MCRCPSLRCDGSDNDHLVSDFSSVGHDDGGIGGGVAGQGVSVVAADEAAVILQPRSAGKANEDGRCGLVHLARICEQWLKLRGFQAVAASLLRVDAHAQVAIGKQLGQGV